MWQYNEFIFHSNLPHFPTTCGLKSDCEATVISFAYMSSLWVICKFMINFYFIIWK